MADDEFELYDLTVIVEAIEGNCTCSMAVGDCFYLRGGKLSLPAGKDFCVYALQATLPLLPAKQRRNHPADWMESGSRLTCADPAGRLVMRVDPSAGPTVRQEDVGPIAWEALRDLPAS